MARSVWMRFEHSLDEVETIWAQFRKEEALTALGADTPRSEWEKRTKSTHLNPSSASSLTPPSQPLHIWNPFTWLGSRPEQCRVWVCIKFWAKKAPNSIPHSRHSPVSPITIKLQLSRFHWTFGPTFSRYYNRILKRLWKKSKTKSAPTLLATRKEEQQRVIKRRKWWQE